MHSTFSVCKFGVHLVTSIPSNIKMDHKLLILFFTSIVLSGMWLIFQLYWNVNVRRQILLRTHSIIYVFATRIWSPHFVCKQLTACYPWLIELNFNEVQCIDISINIAEVWRIKFKFEMFPRTNLIFAAFFQCVEGNMFWRYLVALCCAKMQECLNIVCHQRSESHWNFRLFMTYFIQTSDNASSIYKMLSLRYCHFFF